MSRARPGSRASEEASGPPPERYPRPRVVVSQCLELSACRYDGATIQAPLVRRLEPHVELVPVCPEVAIGLGVPRDPVRLCKVSGTLRPGPGRMVQPSTGRDLTAAMEAFAEGFLAAVGPVEGFVLKSRSPSCGLTDTKVFPGPDSPRPSGRGAGLFARAVLERFGDAAVEDEARLTDVRLRHQFLTKAFTLARLRRVEEAGTMHGLVAFHAAHELLLTAQSQAAIRRLGRIVANPERRPLPDVLADYRGELARSLARPARAAAHVAAAMHALGCVEGRLAPGEKRHFLAALDDYRAGRLPLSAPLVTLQGWIARFGEPCLAAQLYVEPYPRALIGSPPQPL